MSALKIACYQILMKSSLWLSPGASLEGEDRCHTRSRGAPDIHNDSPYFFSFIYFFFSFPLRFLLFFAGSALRRAEESPAKKVNAGVVLLSYGQIPGNM